MKKTLLATTALAVSGFAAGQALAVDVELYGQVNKAMMFVDDGTSTDFSVVDNDASSTRFGLKGSQALDNGLTASVLLEAELDNNASNEVTQDLTGFTGTAPEAAGNGTFAARHARVGLAGDWGAVFIGHQSTATDSVAEQDLVGVGDLMYSDVTALAGGYKIRGAVDGEFLQSDALDADSDNAADATISNIAGNMDGNGRLDAVRYDSPIFNGFQARASVAQGGDMDLAGYYTGKIEGVAVKAALGYVMYNDGAYDNTATTQADELETQLSGSITAAMDNGLAATVAYGQQSLKNKSTGVEDPSFWYAKVGYSWDAFEVAADYGTYEEALALSTDHELNTFGLGGQYNLGNGVSVAGVYRNYEADVQGVSTEDIGVYAMSLRVKF